ncbi:MbcA/ParS/Xre antitoxin family protein [Inquilinus limosus]|uniref:MbcA/ParS/Xre antitoxin family protein n=1 Tax=Inquilinus limosus TaxID=171674 RepID=UPI0003FDBC27|nr:MbcA/ParS/Xre antitoxin family protein [Inquilinus limosus]
MVAQGAAVAPRDAEGRLAKAGLSAFFNIAEAWGLKDEEKRVLLGRPSKATFYRWKAGAAGHPSADTMERISYVLGIYRALQILFKDARLADDWVRRPNAASPFGGRSALDRMLSGNVADLFVVRRYLDAERGGWG